MDLRALPLLLLLLVPPALAELPEKERAKAIRRGMAYLDANLFQLPEASGTPRKPFTYSVAGLCYLMRAETRSGKRNPVERIRKYLEGYVDAVGERLKDPGNLPPRHGLVDSRRLVQYTWPLSAAGLFFLELEQRGRNSAKPLRKILGILEDAQEENGGWGHGKINPGSEPPKGLKGMMGGYPNTLVSSSNCVAITIGLMGAVGYPCDDTIAKARKYYRVARLDNGSYPYDPSQRQSGFAQTNVGRTAGSLFAIHCLGAPRDSAFSGSADYLMKNLEWIKEGHGSPCLNMMHGALCSKMLGKDEWKRFRDFYEPRIVAAQDEDGHLDCICEQKAFGVTCDTNGLFKGLSGAFNTSKQCYTTALHTFVLLLDRGEIRVLEKRKPGPSITPRRSRR